MLRLTQPFYEKAENHPKFVQLVQLIKQSQKCAFSKLGLFPEHLI